MDAETCATNACASYLCHMRDGGGVCVLSVSDPRFAAYPVSLGLSGQKPYSSSPLVEGKSSKIIRKCPMKGIPKTSDK